MIGPPDVTARRSTTVTREPRSQSAGADTARTLVIDIGGSGVKLLRVDEGGSPLGPRSRERTPRPSTPEAVLSLVVRMASREGPFDRVSVGFPGVVTRGVARTAPNLGDRHWVGLDLAAWVAAALERPALALNDADLQGYGVISGAGVEVVLTLGTGLGSALFVDGRLAPNLELAHHPFRRGRTYEDHLSDRTLERVGKRRWCRRVLRVASILQRTFNFDCLYIGGGNARHLRPPTPEYVRVFDPLSGMAGGAKAWTAAPK